MGPAVPGGNRRRFCGRWRDDAAGVAVRSGVGRACSAPFLVSAALGSAEVVNMSDHGGFGGPRFAQLDDDYKVCAAHQQAQLKKEKLLVAFVTDQPAASSDDKKSDPVVDTSDAMSKAALATIQLSFKPVHLNMVTSADTAKSDNTLSPLHPVGRRASQTVLPGSPVGENPPRKKTPKRTHARRRPEEGAPSEKHELCDQKFNCKTRVV